MMNWSGGSKRKVPHDGTDDDGPSEDTAKHQRFTPSDQFPTITPYAVYDYENYETNGMSTTASYETHHLPNPPIDTSEPIWNFFDFSTNQIENPQNSLDDFSGAIQHMANFPDFSNYLDETNQNFTSSCINEPPILNQDAIDSTTTGRPTLDSSYDSPYGNVTLSENPRDLLENHGTGPFVETITRQVSIDTQAPMEGITPRHDVCFGVITINAISDFKGDKKSVEASVSIEPEERTPKLAYNNSGKDAGFAKSEIVAQLLRNKLIQVKATIKASPSGGDRASSIRQELELKSIIYGNKSEADAIGDALSSSSYFLQHPCASDLDSGMEYYNPHLLLRPGSEMPNLELLNLETNTEMAENEVLNESSQAYVMKIFDEAAHSFSERKLSASPRLKSILSRHQLVAMNWLWTMESGSTVHTEIPSLWESCGEQYRHRITGNRTKKPTPFRGGILADEMGLGKTLSMLALICGSLDIQTQDTEAGKTLKTPRTTLVVTPLSTIHNWHNQCKRHIYPKQLEWATYHGPNREEIMKDRHKHHVIFTTYGTMHRDWTTKGPLYSRKWHRVVLDEAHHIRSRSSQTFKAACELNALNRWCLTGTPIHNSLDDLGALVSFIRVPKLMERPQFQCWITQPIKTGHLDSLKRLGLQVLIEATCLRRTKRSADLGVALPKRTEKIALAAKLAQGLFRRSNKDSDTRKGNKSSKEYNILSLINLLRLICNGGESLLPSSARSAWQTSNADLVDLEMLQAAEMSCAQCGSFESQSRMHSQLSCHHMICQSCLDDRDEEEQGEENCPNCATLQGETPIFQKSAICLTEIPAKLALLVNNLQEEQSRIIGDGRGTNKSVVFSTWTKVLDLVQKVLESSGINFQRIDGQTSLKARGNALEGFNTDTDYTVLLATIGSAGEGIDLTAANNIHLVEPNWNPMAEAQAVDRIHRIGQQRQVIITRYITRNSIENYVQWIQKEKIRLIERSMDLPASQAGIEEERKLHIALGRSNA